MGSNNSALSEKDLQILINHIALPPQLPQTEEPDPCRINSNLVKLLQDVARTFDLRTCAAWASVSKMLSALDKTEQAKALNDESLRADLEALNAGGEYHPRSSQTSADTS